MFLSFAASITSLSLIDPPGWIAAVTPASAAAIKPSANGKKASLATTLFLIIELNSSFCALAKLKPSINRSRISGLFGFFVITLQLIFNSGFFDVASKIVFTIVKFSLITFSSTITISGFV